ncbi:MAG: [Fe-S]-binding protein, partial [Anaerolineae bacterium]|nr:[Fe-S]-binding protein [Anaerolineae bacterium]
MLSPIEKMLFVMLTLFAVGAAYVGFMDVYRVIKRGEGELSLQGIVSRVMRALREYLLQTTTLKTRRLVSVLHWGVVLGFTLYFLVNVLDVLIGMVDGFDANLHNLDGFGLLLFDGYRLLADVFSVVVIVG